LKSIAEKKDITDEVAKQLKDLAATYVEVFKAKYK
jgi:hypothetical protein